MFDRLRSAGAALLALALPLPACGQAGPAPAPTATPAAAPAARAAATQADPALWVVRDRDTTIYLFGTIHVLRPGMTWFDSAIRTAFDRSGEVMLEIVTPEPAQMAGLVRTTGIAPPGTPPLTERLPEDRRAAFTAAIVDLGLPATAFDRYRPWLAATQLSVAPISKLGYDAANGPEEVLARAARAAGKPIAGLETPAQQLGFFAGLSEPAQLQFLTSTLDELPTVADTMRRMVDAWAAGDPRALAREMNDSLKDSPELARVLLYERNARWAAWVKARMARPGTVFIAVGAGHLAGDGSVQAELAKLRLRARRVRY